MRELYLYLVVVNVVAFALYGLDKYKAKTGAWRIPEKTLLGIAAIGGSIGALVGMNFFHHKTKHWYFKYGLPAIVAIHLGIAAYFGWIR